METVFGLLNVTQPDARDELTMIANGDDVLYDGEEHSISGFEERTFTLNGNESAETVCIGQQCLMQTFHTNV